MLGIPFIDAYIKLVKLQPVADSVDWLSYYVSSLMLIFAAIAISAKQYFGAPIQCWVPNEFKGSWEKYSEDYCFIASSYYVPMDQEIPQDLVGREDRISYYRWVPIVLALQSLAFSFPNFLWSILHKQTALNPRALVDEAQKCRALTGSEREKEISNLAQYIHDSVQVFDPRMRGRLARSGWNATVLYLFMKYLYVLNAIGQLVMLNYFLGGNYFKWGYNTAMEVIRGEEWQESEIFPRVIMCDFTIRRLANMQRHTVQCVIMMNMINEKLYFFLYWWLSFVAIVSLINFLYHFFIMTIPALRVKFIYTNLNQSELKLFGARAETMREFVTDHLNHDGVLLLHFIRQHIGGRITFDLLTELARKYFQQTRSNTPSKSSNRSDQPLLSRGDVYKRNLPDIQSTYKSSPYHPSSIYPRQNDPSHNDNSMEYIDGTLPMRDSPIRPPGSANETLENVYTTPPKSSMSSV
ncbi:Innexin [Aphelenchoides besseyi]|nr:Innexin [Aphelenchoides besseyi]